ncbi:MAG: NAD/NADP octopine/nopaline dehydrogenase family protein [Firmicutes bacterium]|nr:NAD/NADP octopine/nopaline dehydrogenase family protein [Bacillota bacterium]MCL5039684.1 NAD/NADP octopine/nopaline dehydrogenase family protein [Bacillota bacterium]
MPDRNGDRNLPRFAVLGAGHGGVAMAADLSLRGFSVSLYNRTQERIDPIIARGGIEVDGEVRGFAHLDLVTSHMDEALAAADVVMVVVPAFAHEWMARECAPHLRDGQIVLLNPGRTGGALVFDNIFHQKKVQAEVIIAEAETLLFASRNVGPGQSKVFRIKNAVPVAALPATRTREALQQINAAYPQFIPAANVLKTSLDNMGAIFHPAITLLNTGWIEARMGEFEYYLEGVTPAVARVLEAVDAERMAVARALEVRAISAREWLEMAYGAVGDTLHEAMHNNDGYSGIKAPPNMKTRYLSEDIPASLVPISSLGDYLGVPTFTIKTIIHLASTIHGVDYWKIGRTVKTLGLDGFSVAQVRKLVEEGRKAVH